MIRHAVPIAFAGALLTTTACGSHPTAAQPELSAGVIKEITDWRAKHEADYRREWVTIAGLHDLKQGPNSAGSAKSNDIVLPSPVPATLGRFVLEGQQVRFEPAKAGAASLKGKSG